ncbi:uncharacterized protein BKA78DRAFT_295979 [Phyllosticta capitalensis]|uniref:uncharacterized protein n=1 Tax=Phyllosticta capitalensis TaxID=121624 RepID=UPI00312DA8DD
MLYIGQQKYFASFGQQNSLDTIQNVFKASTLLVVHLSSTQAQYDNNCCPEADKPPRPPSFTNRSGFASDHLTTPAGAGTRRPDTGSPLGLPKSNSYNLPPTFQPHPPSADVFPSTIVARKPTNSLLRRFTVNVLLPSTSSRHPLSTNLSPTSSSADVCQQLLPGSLPARPNNCCPEADELPPNNVPLPPTSSNH